MGCKKFDHGPIDFSYADGIAGTYIGIRENHDSEPHPPNYSPIDTITVVVEDHRTDKVCAFYIDYFHQDYIVKPNGDFVDIYQSYNENTGDYTSVHHSGYFKGDSLLYTQKTNYTKWSNGPWFKLKLVKQ